MDDVIVPDAEDFEVVAVMPRATDASDAEKYRLAQAVKMMRLYPCRSPLTGYRPLES